MKGGHPKAERARARATSRSVDAPPTSPFPPRDDRTRARRAASDTGSRPASPFSIRSTSVSRCSSSWRAACSSSTSTRTPLMQQLRRHRPGPLHRPHGYGAEFRQDPLGDPIARASAHEGDRILDVARLSQPSRRRRPEPLGRIHDIANRGRPHRRRRSTRASPAPPRAVSLERLRFLTISTSSASSSRFIGIDHHAAPSPGILQERVSHSVSAGAARQHLDKLGAATPSSLNAAWIVNAIASAPRRRGSAVMLRQTSRRTCRRAGSTAYSSRIASVGLGR